MSDVGRIGAGDAGRMGQVVDHAGDLLLRAALPLALSALFLWEGVTHYVIAWNDTVSHVRAAGVHPAGLLCAAAGAIVIVGALALLIPGCRRFGAVSLALYTWLASHVPLGALSLAASLGIEPRGAGDVVLIAVLGLLAVGGEGIEDA